MLLQVILFVIIGIAGGVMGGMGMGGGTLLIPLLTIFVGIEQHLAQAINLCAFLPMSIAALIVHIRNKLIEGKHILIVAIPAAAASVGASILSRLVEAKSLSLYFGIFLGAVGIYQFVTAVIGIVKSKRDERSKPAKL